MRPSGGNGVDCTLIYHTVEIALIHTADPPKRVTVVTRQLWRHNANTPAKTELTGCFGGRTRSGRARTAREMISVTLM